MITPVLLLSILAAVSYGKDIVCPDGLILNSESQFCYDPKDIRKDANRNLTKQQCHPYCPEDIYSIPSYTVPSCYPRCPENVNPLPDFPVPSCHPTCPENLYPNPVYPVPSCHPTCPENLYPNPVYPVNPVNPVYPVNPVQPVLPVVPNYSTCPGYPGYPGYGYPVGTCPICNDMCQVHFLHDARDCTVFYMCDWGCPIWKRCPAGLHFNRQLNVCDYPWRAGCEYTGQPHCQ